MLRSPAIRAGRHVGEERRTRWWDGAESGGVARPTTCQRMAMRAIVNIVRC
jgi:hypothetical protein